jgi:hypothetical protein
VHDEIEYPLDVLIYVTGFQWMGTGSFNMIRGRYGETLREKWERRGVKAPASWMSRLSRSWNMPDTAARPTSVPPLS